MPILKLSEQLASQIAAGEVVERPASVVKELLENALDAGATRIEIDIENGGQARIRVADNGQGIPAAEVETAFQRHATSKLRQASDLNAIATLGFRGEALAAISAVSKTTVVTRAEGEAEGTQLIMDGGIVASREKVGAPPGTVISVDELFFNVPARLKFLKSVTAERRQIDEVVTRYALAYPDVRLRLSHNDKVTFQTTGNGQLRDVLLAVYGPARARDLLPVVQDDELVFETSGSQAGLSVSGYVGPPSLHWSSRNHIILFVNGRWVHDNRLTYAVVKAYHTLLPTGRYPLAVLFLRVPFHLVDVNVHPTKSEIRFRQGISAFGLVQRAVRQTLVGSSPVRPAASLFQGERNPGWGGFLDGDAFQRRNAQEGQQTVIDWGSAEDELPEIKLPPPRPKPLPSDLGGERLPIMRVVGQVGASYIIAEGPDGLYLIDQHAAHERILYEQFLAAYDGAGLAQQGLVTGVPIHLTPSQATLLEDNLDHLREFGFQIEPFGPNAFMVRGVPALLARIDPERAIRDVVEELERGDKPLQVRLEDKIVRRVCKTASVKAGQTLSQQEMEAMIRQLELCHSPHTCPHGRPTLIHLSVAQLARQFGRI